MAVDVVHGMEAEVTAPLIIQDGCEDAGGVEPGEAQPVYRAVRANQGGGVQVTYDAVVFYREISHTLFPWTLKTLPGTHFAPANSERQRTSPSLAGSHPCGTITLTRRCYRYSRIFCPSRPRFCRRS